MQRPADREAARHLSRRAPVWAKITVSRGFRPAKSRVRAVASLPAQLDAGRSFGPRDLRVGRRPPSDSSASGSGRPAKRRPASLRRGRLPPAAWLRRRRPPAAMIAAEAASAPRRRHGAGSGAGASDTSTGAVVPAGASAMGAGAGSGDGAGWAGRCGRRVRGPGAVTAPGCGAGACGRRRRWRGRSARRGAESGGRRSRSDRR